jgi:hypothetical protein
MRKHPVAHDIMDKIKKVAGTLVPRIDVENLMKLGICTGINLFCTLLLQLY